MISLEDLKKALEIHKNQLKQSKLDQDYAELIIPTIEKKIKELEKNAPICPSEGN